MRKFVSIIDTVTEWSGRAVSILVYPVILVVLTEVILRYGFNSPTIWVHETSAYMFGALAVAGGGYVILHGGHITIDLVSGRMAPRKRAILEMVLSLFFFFFVYMVLWQGSAALLRSIAWNEHTQSVWGPPQWPLKMFVPVGGALLLLAGISKFVKDLYTALGKGKI